MATNPHIYVSSVHGTNTGASDTSYASQQTGAMTSLTAGNVYDNIESAIAGASPTSGDTIYVADDHAASYSGSTGAIAADVILVSVDASNIDQYSPGASDTRTDFGAWNVPGNAAIYGVSLKTNDNTISTSAAEGVVVIQDMTVGVGSATDVGIWMNDDGRKAILTNVDIDGGTSDADCFKLSNGNYLIWNGGAVIDCDTLFNGTLGGNGGATAIITGVDLSPILTLTANFTTAADCVFLRLDSCKLNSSVTLLSTFGGINQRFEMYNCDNGTDDVYHRFYIADYAGTAKNNDTTYVTATESWYEGSDKSSIEVTTTANCSHAAPFIFELPAQYVDLSQAASDVITIDLVTDSTAVSLTDTDIAAFLVYPDGTTAVQANWVTSGKTVGTGNYGIDPLAAGTALSASSLGAGDWTGEPASANFYKMELDTSGDAGQATAVSIRIEIYKASIASGDLFIHPLLTLS